MKQNNKQIGQIVPYNYTIKLDKKDQQLLSLLITNARLHYSEFAKALNISKSNVIRRITILEQKNVIKGYHAFVNASKVGIQSAILLLQTKTTEDEKEQFIKNIQDNPHIYSIVELTGKYDILIAIYYSSEKEKDALVEDILTHIEIKDFLHMVHKTQFPLLNYFSESIHRLPINPLTILTKTQIEKYDSIDLHILAILSQNCRRTSVEISTFLKISRETVNYRIKRIISGGAIAKFQPTINFYLLGFECYFMILKLCKPTQRKRIIHFFKETQKCNTILVSASGNLMVFIQFPNNKEYRLFENKLFSHFSTAIYEYSFVLVKKQHKLEWFPEKLISYIT